ncbi:lisH domain-containing protein ARMC9 isoform X2 [Halictus rubicundus]|uniref:lisH domain-containing protein ARMC9 isoform X2 n=1 Tax=Halictus rubicundus TaxID=77578 RepID=UPI0040374F44
MDKNHIIDQVDNKNLKLIHQFLLDHKLENTAETLLAEVETRNFKNFPKALRSDIENYLTSSQWILMAFKSGDWRNFFNIWNSLIPEDVKETRAYKVLTLNLHVYFAILPQRTMLSRSCKEQVILIDKMQTNTIKSISSLSHHSLENQEDSMIELKKDMYECMEHLREFLNSTGKELEDDTELKPFVALLFTEEPYAEPSLSKVFEKKWVDELTESLLLFLEECKLQNFRDSKYNDIGSRKEDSIANKIPEKRNVPIVPNDRNIPLFIEDDELEEQYSLSDNTKYARKFKSVQTISTISSTEEGLHSSLLRNNKKLAQCTEELTITKSHLYTVQSNYEKLKTRFHKLHADYHKLMSIARVLTNVLENSVKGQTIDFQAMLETCIQIFPDLFNQNIKDNSYCSSEALLAKSHSQMKIVDQTKSYITPVPPKLLNFKKIKLHLINGSIKTKLFLLQALRRKITRGQPGEKEEALHEYISKDLLGLYGRIASYKGTSILPYLLIPDNISMPHPLQQSTTRLLNALASFRCGRDYLSFDSTAVDVVFKCLNSTYDNDIDTFTCNMMIAMLQKLSLRKQQRIYMIENGLVEWLIRHLHVHHRVMDIYRLEYATALLMNLSLHQIARRRASTLASLLISTLTDLLLTDRSSILPYITGALNHFLTNHSINEEAKKMKFSRILEQYIKYKDGEVRDHLEHILKIHRGEIIIKTEIEEVADNDDEEFDVMENDLEENDPVKNNYGELCGETLLASCYATSRKSSDDKEINLEILSQSFIHDDGGQVKSLHYEHTSVSNGQHLQRFVDKEYQVKNKKNITTVEESMKETYLSSKFHAPSTKLVSVHKAQQIHKQRINEKWNFLSDATTTLESSELLTNNCTERNLGKVDKQINTNPSNDKKFTNNGSVNRHLKVTNYTNSLHKDFESAEYLYGNQLLNGKYSKTTLASSMNLDENDVGSVADSTVMEKLSSIASLNASDDNKAVSDNTSYTQEIEFDTEDAFLAKPKLPRTPQ